MVFISGLEPPKRQQVTVVRRSIRALAAAVMSLVSVTFATVGPSLAAPSPTSSPASAAQLSHTVTMFGLMFFAVAIMAVVLFIVVFVRLRQSGRS